MPAADFETSAFPDPDLRLFDGVERPLQPITLFGLIECGLISGVPEDENLFSERGERFHRVIADVIGIDRDRALPTPKRGRRGAVSDDRFDADPTASGLGRRITGHDRAPNPRRARRWSRWRRIAPQRTVAGRRVCLRRIRRRCGDNGRVCSRRVRGRRICSRRSSRRINSRGRSLHPRRPAVGGRPLTPTADRTEDEKRRYHTEDRTNNHASSRQ